jgi:ABC-type Mn2+/Zn2+ transport system permease subunit
MLNSIMTAFQSSFMQLGLIASVLIGAACGYMSVYVILKRLVFLAIALAQCAAAAVAVALFINFKVDGAHLNLTLAAFVGVMLGALFFSWPALGRYLPRENAIGTGYALASSIGIILIQKNASGEEHLMNLLYGNVLTVEVNELWMMGAIILVVGTLFLTFTKEFLFTSFDPEMAQTVGVRPKLWEVLFNVSLGLVIAMAIRLGGMMLVFSLLVLPGYAALLSRCRIRQAFIWAVVIAVLTGAVGLYLSYIWDLTSAVTMAALGVCVVLGAGIGALRARWGRQSATTHRTEPAHDRVPMNVREEEA